MNDFIKAHIHDDVNELALQGQKYPDIDMRKVVVQIKGWQIAEKKLPLWTQTDGIIFPEHLPLEQCSSQLTAEYKATLLSELPNKDKITDLTGGFGVDATILGRQFNTLTYVERNPELCEIAKNNLPKLGIKELEVYNKSCEEVIDSLPHQNLIFIDPARRDSNGKKTVAISDCTPDVCTLNKQMLDKADMVMIKLSPMLNLSSAEQDLKGVETIHIISVNGECKEVLVVLSNKPTENIQTTCVNIIDKGTQTFTFNQDDEQKAECHYTEDVKDFLYEPNASLMKGKCFKLLANRFDLLKLSPNSHLYTSSQLIKDFPGRSFKVEKTFSLNKQDAKELKSIGKANITVRNFPSTVDELKKKLKLHDGGDVYLFATTLSNDKKIIIKTIKQ